ncbi:MAG: serine/threonine-protein kinase [Proteobacteria bacterium]|nr:serine/threonine-protein kinase [Pseudomonadota bacterium]
MISPGLRIGKYELTRQLGRGGFGVVFVAIDHSLGRECALKFLLPEHGARPDLLERFVLEARSAAQVGHAGIVTVFECGVFQGTGTPADGTAFIAMELLEGESLAMRLHRHGPMPEVAARVLVRQVAAALGAAHAEGIVHRDLKPDNIFLVPDATTIGGERVKVLDFGIAKLGDDTETSMVTATFAVFGTPRYMSPEQCRSTTNVDARTDIYALGCIMFELVCGRAPFAGESGEQIAHHQLTAPPRVRALRPDISEVYDETVAVMLAKRVDGRPPTMAAVLRLLDRTFAAGTVEPAPPGPPPSDANATIASVVPPVRHPRPATAPPRRTWPLLAGFAAIAAIAVTIVLVATARSPGARAVAIDAAIASGKPDARCQPLVAAESWSKVAECAEEVRATGDVVTADRLTAQAAREILGVGILRELGELISRYPTVEDVIAVYSKLDPTSIYQAQAKGQIRSYFRGVANELALYHQCLQVDNLRSAVKTLPLDTQEELMRTPCMPRGDISKLECSLDGPTAEMSEAAKSNDWATVLARASEAIDCRSNQNKPSLELSKVATIAACRLHDAWIAHIYNQGTASDQHDEIVSACKNAGISLN